MCGPWYDACGCCQWNCEPDSLPVEDPDFVAVFNKGRWTVSWWWTRESPKKLQTRVSEYKCTQTPMVRERYYAALEKWISKGCLRRWNGPVKGIIPLLAVFQLTKDKEQPVMDYRELNAFVECHTGDEMVAVCGEQIRKWRQLRWELRVVDLKSAYLQIQVSEELWKYKSWSIRGVPYTLTRLCALRIMTSIFGKVLSLDDRVRWATNHDIDDIVVQESVVDTVQKHLAEYGLGTKKPWWRSTVRNCLKAQRMVDLQILRATALLEFAFEPLALTKRGLFSWCGKLVNHYPVAGWRRL